MNEELPRFSGRPTPAWFDDAKLGIMVQWGPSSVPAWAPRSGRVWDVADQFRDNPYAEWYRNSLKHPDSPTRERHDRIYGPDFAYERFGPMFNEATRSWDPGAWAELFATAGARYIVPTSKHHDGFLLWPSAHHNPYAPTGYFSERDLMGELADAARARGIEFGIYYSGGIDWLWNDVQITTASGLGPALPRDPAYEEYAYSHWRELIDRYAPVCLWNDIWMPGSRGRVEELFAYYYDRVPHGVVNDRYKMRATAGGYEPGVHCDTRTPEYQDVPDIRPQKWEQVRGLGHSFGFNQDEDEGDYVAPDALIRLFIDIVSKNGNLLLDVGPRADGSIPELQRERLEALGAWLGRNGEAIYGTRPWQRAEGATRDGTPLRFTTKPGTLFLHVLGSAPATFWLRDLHLLSGPARLLGVGDITCAQDGPDIRVELPAAQDGPAFVLALPLAH